MTDASKKDLADLLGMLEASKNPHYFEYTMRDGRTAVIDRALTSGDFVLAGHAGEMALLKCTAGLVKVDGKLLTTTEWCDMPLENSAPVIGEVTKRLMRAFGMDLHR